MKEGVLVPSDKYKYLYLHKTDACSNCQILKKSVRSLTQRQKRNTQQGDQGSLLHQEPLREVSAKIDEVKELLKAHRIEATDALEYHKKRTKDMSDKLQFCMEQYQDLMHLLRQI